MEAFSGKWGHFCCHEVKRKKPRMPSPGRDMAQAIFPSVHFILSLCEIWFWGREVQGGGAVFSPSNTSLGERAAAGGVS